MFNLLGQALSRILFLKEIKKYDEALVETDNAAKSILGLNIDAIERMPVGGLKSILGSDPAVLHSRFYTAGSLLKVRGEILEFQEKEDESVRLYMKSLSLFMEEFSAFEEFDGGKEIQAIDFVIEKLRDYELPLELKERLADYFEKMRRYDKLEDTIFEIIDEDVAFVQNGISFYERLLLKPDDELTDGHLPRNEVEDGLAELRNKLVSR
jgi:tetratricopeptide (TPR) repeat protein